MKWLVLGKSGQLGQELCAQLVNSAEEIIPLDYRDLFENSDFDKFKLLEIHRPDFMVNCVAWTNVESAEQSEKEARLVNAEWPRIMADVALKLQIPLMHISTDYVFSGNRDKPWNTYSPQLPLNAYGRTKVLAENYILASYPENSYIFRTAWLYSRHRNNFVKTMIGLANSGKSRIQVVDDQIGQPTSAFDLANQILLSLREGLSPGVYHATNSGSASWLEFAIEIFNLIGANPDRLVGISTEEFGSTTPRPKYSVLSHECWEKVSFPAMRNWKYALSSQIKEIQSAVALEVN